MTNGVSVVICCYNSSARLPATLSYLLSQVTNGISWEVIVVDNASSDNTMEVAAQHAHHFDGLADYYVISEPNPGLSHARALGIEKSRFDHVLFCDDDNWLSSDYIKVAYNTMQSHSQVGACGGKGTPVFETSEPDWFKNFLRPYAVGQPRQTTGIIEDNMSFLTGAGMMLSLNLWRRITGHKFESLLSDRKGKSLSSGGDLEICYMIRLSGYKLFYIDEISYQHFIPRERLSESYLKKLHKGIGNASAYLSAYQHVLNRLPTEKRFQWVRVLGILAPKFFRFTISPGQNLSEKMQAVAFKSYYGELWRLKSKYDKAIVQIAATAAAIQEENSK